MMEKVYICTQLCAVLHPIACKLLLYITLWQNSTKGLLLYVHSFAKTLKLTEDEVRMGIQTLLNLNLIRLVKAEDKFKIELVADTFKKYLNLPLQKAIEHDGFPLATDVTWDKENEKREKDISDMSDDDLKRLLLRIEAQLSERSETKKRIVNYQEPKDDLPW